MSLSFEARFTPEHRLALAAEHRVAYDAVVASLEERFHAYEDFRVLAADGSNHCIRGSDLVHSAACKHIVVDTVLEGQRMKTFKSLKGIMAIQPWQEIMKEVLEAQGVKVRVTCVCLIVLIVLCMRLILRSRPCSSHPTPTRSSIPTRRPSGNARRTTTTARQPRSRTHTAWAS